MRTIVQILSGIKRGTKWGLVITILVGLLWIQVDSVESNNMYSLNSNDSENNQ